MQTVFSTNEVHARDRFDYWHDIACKTIIQHSSEPECRHTFQAEIQISSLSDVDLVKFESSPMTVTHSSRHIRRATGDELFVCRQIAGELALEQGGRDVLLQAGDFTLLDPLLPYTGIFSPTSKLLVFKIPRRALEARIGNTRDVTVRAIKPLNAESSLASDFLVMLTPYASSLTLPAQEIVKHQALDLIAVSLAKTMEGKKPRISSARSLALSALRAAIDARLADPALDATSVAAAAGISVRYANTVLAEEGTSIMRLIQTKRLDRCRVALEDKAQAHRTVSDIAYGWGFSDMTHFGRRFKATFGAPPSDWRRRTKLI